MPAPEQAKRGSENFLGGRIPGQGWVTRIGKVKGDQVLDLTPVWSGGDSMRAFLTALPTIRAIADPHDLTLTLDLNGEERQRTSTGDMIYDIWDQIEYLSTVMTREPGDLITTCTPSNVGIATGTFMKPGDVVRVAVEGLGEIENRFIAGV